MLHLTNQHNTGKFYLSDQPQEKNILFYFMSKGLHNEIVLQSFVSK